MLPALCLTGLQRVEKLRGKVGFDDFFPEKNVRLLQGNCTCFLLFPGESAYVFFFFPSLLYICSGNIFVSIICTMLLVVDKQIIEKFLNLKIVENKL